MSDWFDRQRIAVLWIPPGAQIAFVWSIGSLVRGAAIGIALCLITDFIRSAA